jgi:hypothetical protein
MNKENYKNRGGGDMVYCIGLIGALVYYIQTASGFVGVLFAIFKGIFWPGYLVYELLRFLS